MRAESKKLLFKVLVPIVAVVLSLVIGGIVIATTGVNPFTAYGYLLRGAFGSPQSFGERLVKATPLIFTGLAAVFASVFYFLLPFELEVRQALVILVFSPIGSAVPGFTQELKGDVGLSSALNSFAMVIGIAITVVLLLVML